MFQGMKSGDEMQVNVRIVGCVNPQDCNVVSIGCHNDPLQIANKSIAQFLPYKFGIHLFVGATKL